jgi:nicotinate-nucleotide adenylyltransferase
MSALTVALFGGSFNPPHLAHVLAAQLVLASGAAQRVWVIPCGTHPFAKDLLDFATRLKLCHLAFDPLGPRVEVLDLEGQRSPSYTIDTVEDLKARFPEHSFRLLLGTDNLADLARWKDSQRLLELAPPLVIGRLGHQDRSAYLPLALPDVSSSEVRARLSRGDGGALALLPAEVGEFIKRQGLYGTGDLEKRGDR